MYGRYTTFCVTTILLQQQKANAEISNLAKMASVAKVGEDEEAAETQQHSFTEADVSQLHEKVRELARLHTSALVRVPLLRKRYLLPGELDSELQEMSDLQERGNRLQGALKELQEYVETLFTEDEVSQMDEKIRDLAQQVVPEEFREGWLGELDSKLRQISGLQERGNYL